MAHLRPTTHVENMVETIKRLHFRLYHAAGMALTAALLAAPPSRAGAQVVPVELPSVYPPPDAQPPDLLTQAQLDRLVAPIALYPDPLLTDILAASTYPAQVVEAQRFLADPANRGVQGDTLAAASLAHHWHDSVQALLAFPPVLALLDTRLEWTDQLGQAFQAQPADVLEAVQRLRRRAQAAGSLAGVPQASVTEDGGAITILPPAPQEVFLPSYDPSCVFGQAEPCGTADAVSWGDGVFLPFDDVPWGWIDWRSRRIHAHRAGWHAVPPKPAAGSSDGTQPWPRSRPAAGTISAHAVPPDGFQYAPPAWQRIAAQGGAKPPPLLSNGRSGLAMRTGAASPRPAPALHTAAPAVFGSGRPGLGHR